MLKVGDYVTINRNVIDNRIRVLTGEGKHKLVAKWNTYYNTIFKVMGEDENHLLIIVDAQSNDIHISRNAIEFYELPKD